jgi:hypothetical protein
MISKILRRLNAVDHLLYLGLRISVGQQHIKMLVRDRGYYNFAAYNVSRTTN